MSKSFNTITHNTDDSGVTTLTIDRPNKLNALNDEVLNELAQFFKSVQVDKDLRAVIIKGAGDKAFAAGADIKELQELGNRSGRMASQKGQQIFQLIVDTRKPVIAAINGFALGGGLELAMACHMRIAGQDAVLGLPEVGLGLIPGYGGTQRLSELIGRSRALEMILTGKQISADEAFQMGLVNDVTDGDVYETAQSLADDILENGPIAIQSALKAVYHSGNQNGYQIEADLFGELCDTDDFIEGTTAFLEGRDPNFEGH
ncbi:enoyl-CoA hydratase [Fodinibius salinus]|uniref:Enoyl-CoA hydratase n=1 Tax=Fodinibius salinus TaxID=860790 RepID=A0A5D3YJD6_9BACT|nr:enoyl-CoA hydratase-related protein [Fodinibius salinus]TYP92620.1 enoyl-CoA hydratase [Fodinibius salinus]